MNWIKHTLILLSLLCVGLLRAQNYPVNVSVVTSGPFYNYLSYYSDDNNHLRLLVTLTDFNSGPINVRLRMKMEGNGYQIVTNPNVPVGPVYTLTPGIPTIIDGNDLIPFFQQQNIIKSPSNLNINKLPFGLTTFCFDVIKVGLNELVGKNYCSSFLLNSFQPAISTTPFCASFVDTINPFISFQWTQPLGYVPAPGIDLVYNFWLYEWIDTNNYSVFQGNQGLVYQDQLINPFYQHSTFSYPLQKGKKYVWRTQAVTTSFGNPVDMFDNDGFSAPCSFRYGEAISLEEQLAAGLQIDLSASANTPVRGKAQWTVTQTNPSAGGLSTYSSYIIDYRKKPTGNEGFAIPWISDSTSSSFLDIYQLEDSTVYEVKIRGRVGGFTSEYTDVVDFTTPPRRIYACGEADLPLLPPVYNPLPAAEPGMTVKIGQFDLTFTQVTPTGLPGHFAGKGLVPIDFIGGAKAKVSFTNLKIDDQFIVHSGTAEVVTDGLDNWLDQQYEQFIDPFYVDGVIDSAYVSGGMAWVVVDGVAQSFVFDPADMPIFVRDDSGMEYKIYPDGTVVVSSYLEISNDNLDVGAQAAVVFQQNDGETYGFDAKEHMAWADQYELIKLNDNTNYFVPNKSLGVANGDTVDFKFNDSIWEANDIYFKLDNDSLNLPVTASGNLATVFLPNNLPKGKYKFYAMADGLKLGKLNILVYEKKEKEVVIVPLIANYSFSKSDIEGILDQTFGEANVDVEVTIAAQWNDSTFSNTNAIDAPTEVGLLNKYSDEMRNLRDAYFDDTNAIYKDKAYYLFVVPSFSDPNLDGYMVRGKGLGFVSASASLLTYAHELGHGIGSLDHSWKNNGPEEGATNNLMDYSSNPKELTLDQWKELRDFDLIPSMMDEVEDGAGGGPVYYYNVIVDGSGKILERHYNSRQTYTKQTNQDKSITKTTVNYTTGVNKFYRRQSNGNNTFLRYEHFGKVFYMSEITNNEGEHIRYGSDYDNSNTLKKTKDDAGQPADGIYQVTNLYVNGATSFYAREVRDATLKPVIDYYRPGTEAMQVVYFNDINLSNQFRDKLVKLEERKITYGDVVLWLESHPRRMSTLTPFTTAQKQNAINKFQGASNVQENGPMYNQINAAYNVNTLLPFVYADAYNQTYLKGLRAKVIKEVNGYWVRESIEIPASGVYQASNGGSTGIHGQHGASNCQHSLVDETNDVNGLKLLLDNSASDADDFAEYIGSKPFCFLYGLNISGRKQLLTKVVQDDGSWVANSRNILNEIIKTTTGNDEKTILEHLKANNFALLRSLHEQLEEWLDFSDASSDLPALFRAFGTLSSDLVQHKSNFPNTSATLTKTYSLPIENYPGTNFPMPTTSYDIPYPKVEFPIVIGGAINTTIELGGIAGISSTYGANSGLKIITQGNHQTLPLEFLPSGKIKINQNYKLVEYYDGLYFSAAGSNSNLEDITIYEVTPYELSPYDYVDVVIGANYGGAQYDKGDIIQVPLMTALLIQQAIDNDLFNQNFRLAVNIIEVGAGIVAVAAAPFSGGASVGTYVALVAGIKGATDIAIQNYQNTLPSAQYNDNFYKTWNNIAMAVDVATGVYALPSMVNGVVKIGQSSLHYGRTMVFAISFHRAVRTTKLTGNVSNVFDFQRARAISQSFRKGALVDGFGAYVSGAGNFAKLTTKSSLNTTLFNQLDNALASAPSIKFNYGSKALQSPKQFLNEVGNGMHDISFSNGGYAKFDNVTGRMLYTDGTKQYFVHYTSGNNLTNVEQLMTTRVTQLRNYLGLNGFQSIILSNGLGAITPSTSKATTFIGKTTETQILKNQFGDFKHIKVGESSGSVNLLNMPDTYYNPTTWFDDFNKDWMLRAIQRGDDIYIASPINPSSLYNKKPDNTLYGSYFANELNELVVAGFKPKNITQVEWNNVIPDIQAAAAAKY